MSKISLLLNAVLLVMVAYLFWDVSQLKGLSTEAGSMTRDNGFANTAETNMIIGVLHNDSINANYGFIVDQQAKFEKESAKSEAKVNKSIEDTEYYSLLQYAQTAPDSEREMVANLLATAEQKIQQVQETESKRLSDLQDAYVLELSARVKSFLEGYCAERNISVLLNYYPNTGNLLYSDNHLDVTSEVVEGLNSLYSKEKEETQK